MDADMSLVAMFDRACDSAGERSAILVEADDDTTEATSFAALQRASRALARRLGDLGVRAADVVAVACGGDDVGRTCLLYTSPSPRDS